MRGVTSETRAVTERQGRKMGTSRRVGSFAPPTGADTRPIGLYARAVRAGHAGGPEKTAPVRIVAGSVHLREGDTVAFDTYFGAFPVGKWHRHTSLRTVSVDVATSGSVRIDAVHTRLGAEPTVVASAEPASTGLTTHTLTLPPLIALVDGAVHVRVTCLGDSAAVAGGAWRSDDPPGRDIRLGVVITTYNRSDYVRANLAHLERALAGSPELAECVRVVVVDNARNVVLPTFTATHVTTLANPNTGGAGGFTRGLMHLRDEGWATHALFMDDDVSFDPEILERTIALMAHATDPMLCVAGAMLANQRPTEIFEAGAGFCGTRLDTNHPFGQGLDLEEPDELLRADVENGPIDYGAWWFYAFPLTLTRANPLPVFVRGDDVLWGLLHAGGHTVTCRGIGLWHDDFETRNGPHAWFYETRNLALVGVLAVPGYRWWHLLTRYVNLCARSMLSLKYDSAANITFAVQEFLRGPQHWMELDQAVLNARVSSFEGERIELLATELRDLPELSHRTGPARVAAAAVSICTLGGHLLPRALDRRSLRAAKLPLRVLGESTARGAIVFRDADATRGFVARRDRRRFFSLFTAMVRTASAVPFRFRRLRRAYRAAYPEMVSDAYWQRQFRIGIDSSADDAVRASA
jgi:galactofuranosylgalactofuranosylrhamnosyl-N-acetylglucosaminyl-diphospho-decaprenol beta-1,5/1,6-galactofuranosyltransferase